MELIPRDNYLTTRDGRPFDHRILKFRYEVLREDIHSLAEAFHVPVEFLSSLARAEQWTRIEIDEAQESRIAEVQRAAQLRIQCLATLRQLDRFYALASLEDQALAAISEKLKDPTLTPHELARLVNSLKVLKEGLVSVKDPEDLPEPVRAYIDIRAKEEQIVERAH